MDFFYCMGVRSNPYAYRIILTKQTLHDMDMKGLVDKAVRKQNSMLAITKMTGNRF